MDAGRESMSFPDGVDDTCSETKHLTLNMMNVSYAFFTSIESGIETIFPSLYLFRHKS